MKDDRDDEEGDLDEDEADPPVDGEPEERDGEADEEGAVAEEDDDLDGADDDDDDDLDDDGEDDDDLDDDGEDDDDLDEGEEDDDRDESSREGRRGPRAGAKETPRSRRPTATPLQVGVLVVVLAACTVYAVNGLLNLQAREAVIQVCLAEDGRLERAIGQRAELNLPVTDWMVTLYGARRQYVTELCDRTIEQLSWWRWNIGTPIRADIALATAQDISRSLEEASSSCEEEVRGLEAALERHAAERGGDPALEARVRDVTMGQLEACAGLRRAVRSSRPGFWPALEADSVGETAARMAELMPESPPDYEATEPGGDR